MDSKWFRGLWFFADIAWRYGKSYLFLQLALQGVVVLITLASVVLPKHLLDALSVSASPAAFVWIAGAWIASMTFGKTLRTLLTTFAFERRLAISDRFHRDLLRHMAEADYVNIESKDFLDLREKAQKFLYSDWHGFCYVLDSAFEILGRCLSLAGLVLVLWRIQPLLLTLCVALALLDSVVAAWAKRQRITLSMEAASVQRYGTYIDDLFEDHRYGKEVRIYGLRDWLLKRNEEHEARMFDFYRRSGRYWRLSSLFSACAGMLRLGLSDGYLILRTLSGALSLGEFTMGSGAVAAFGDLLCETIQAVIDIKQYGLYYDAMRDFLNVPRILRARATQPLPSGEMTFVFDRVSFRYPGQTIDALRDVSLTLTPGMKLAIVGENGAGKTTFIKLLTRLYAPTSGRILLNGVDIQTLDYDAYMKRFAVVFQDFELYAFSLKENIVFGDAGQVTDANVQALLEQVGLGQRVRTLPKGLETPVAKTLDPDGFEPSGGEGQKIALARALYRKADVVILDEPTAALDPRAEYELYQRFDALSRGKTTVYISHRLSSARLCDQIAVFQAGRVAEMGTHSELMADGGLYAQLYDMQRKSYSEDYPSKGEWIASSGKS